MAQKVSRLGCAILDVLGGCWCAGHQRRQSLIGSGKKWKTQGEIRPSWWTSQQGRTNCPMRIARTLRRDRHCGQVPKDRIFQIAYRPNLQLCGYLFRLPDDSYRRFPARLQIMRERDQQSQMGGSQGLRRVLPNTFVWDPTAHQQTREQIIQGREALRQQSLWILPWCHQRIMRA